MISCSTHHYLLVISLMYIIIMCFCRVRMFSSRILIINLIAYCIIMVIFSGLWPMEIFMGVRKQLTYCVFLCVLRGSHVHFLGFVHIFNSLMCHCCQTQQVAVNGILQDASLPTNTLSLLDIFCRSEMQCTGSLNNLNDNCRFKIRLSKVRLTVYGMDKYRQLAYCHFLCLV